MKFHGITLEEGSKLSNLAVASGSGSFPSSPDEGELYFRTDAAVNLKGMYCYIAGAWNRVSSSNAVTVPVGTSFPATENIGDLFYKNTNDAFEALYVYSDSAWVPVIVPSYTISGDVSGTIDGGTDALTLATVNSNVGTFASVTVNAKGLVTAAAALSGDATTSSSTITLATVNSNVGSFGTATDVSTVTVNAKGLVTAASNTPIAIAASQTTSGTFADARISQASVTQHQAALTILESQITDSTVLARNAGNETITGNWTFNNAVVGTAPSSASHLTTKEYVDNALLGLTWKLPVLATTTANITLSGTQTIDGVSLNVGNRVLVKNQSSSAENGIYTVASGAWVRATDFDSLSPLDEINGAAVFVTLGTTQADTGWVETATVATIGTDPITFVQFSAAGAYTAGAGLSLSGNTFNVGTASAARIVVNVDDIDLATVTDAGTGTFLKLTRDAYGRVSGTTAVVTADITGLVDATYVNTTGDTMTGNLTVTASSGQAIVRTESTDTTGSARFQISADGANNSQFNQYGTTAAGNFMTGVPLAGLTALFSPAVSTGLLISQQSTSAPLIFATSATSRMTIGSAGNVTIAAPTSGVPLTVNAVPGANANAIVLNVASATSENIIQWQLNSLTKGIIGVIGTAAQLAVGSVQNDFIIRNASNILFTANAGSNIHLRIATNGDVGIGTGATAPSSRLHIANTATNALGVYRDLDVTSVGAAATFIDLGARNGATFTPGAQVVGVLENPATTGYLEFYTRTASTLSARMKIGSGGNVTINAPSSGAALTVTSSVASTPGLTVSGSSINMADFESTAANGGYIRLITSATVYADIGTQTQTFGAGGAGNLGINARGATELGLGTNNTKRLFIGSAGNVTINAPSSGFGLSIASASGIALTANGATIDFTNTGAGNGQINYSGSTFLELVPRNAAAGVRVYYANGSLSTTWSSTGNVTIAAPGSGTALTVTAVAGALAASFPSGPIKTQTTTVAGLLAAATAGAGARSFVTDATATTFASAVVGGGANGVPVYSDGTTWRIG